MRPILRRWIGRASVILGTAVVAGALLAQAQEPPRRGEIKSVDADRGTITVTIDGRDRVYPLAPNAQVVDAYGQSAEGGLNHEGFRPGAQVALRIVERDGRAVLTGVKLVSRDVGAFVKQAPPNVDMSGVKALADMGKGDLYKGHEGGLYPGGAHDRPAAHEAAGQALARQIRPLDRDGAPDPDGKIVLLGVGMSNTMQAMSGFLRAAAAATDQIQPRVTIVNGANGGMTADKIQHLNGGRTYANNPNFVYYWKYVDDKLSEAGATREQVQAVWLKEADPGPEEGWPGYARKLQGELANIMRLMHDRFPNLKLVYVSNRIYGGWAKTRLNPEPYAYETGFAVKWLIEQQIGGDPSLNFDPERGQVKSPWLSWGPDLWANGTNPRNDGFHYVEGDVRADDGTHEAVQGQDKVGRELLRFFTTDTTTRGWFARATDGTGRRP
jgi:hypothetical protein